MWQAFVVLRDSGAVVKFIDKSYEMLSGPEAERATTALRASVNWLLIALGSLIVLDGATLDLLYTAGK